MSAKALGIYLEPTPQRSTRVGTLLREQNVSRFIVDEGYLAAGPNRPILSAAFFSRDNESNTITRLQSDHLKTATSTRLPPFFSHLLPEGELRDLVLSQIGSSSADEFTLLQRLGADLPGAVVARDDTGHVTAQSTASPPLTDNEIDAPRLKFSLAGIQLKFSMLRTDHKLIMPASGTGGKIIAKMPSQRWPFLCEAEFLGMRLAQAAGVRVARSELLPSDRVEGIRRDLIPGPYVLAVDRFDRIDSERVHMEEFAPILGIPSDGDAKYKQNTETVVNLISRFSANPVDDVLEAIRRIVVNVLLGNGDAHLKNWAFVYHQGREPRLSPAYDIVPTVLYLENDSLALKFGGSNSFTSTDRRKFARLAGFIKASAATVLDEVDLTIERALDTWPDIVRNSTLPREYLDKLLIRWRPLKLSGHLPNPFRGDKMGHAELAFEGKVLAEPEKLVPSRFNLGTERSISFTIANAIAIDIAMTYELRYSDGKRYRLAIASIHPTRTARTRVTARILDDEQNTHLEGHGGTES